MGLLDKLIKIGKEAVAAAQQSSTENTSYTAPSPAPASAAAPAVHTDNRDCREKLLGILSSEFAGYTVRENVSPATIGGSGRFMNYSLAVYSGETPKLFIMIIGKTTCSHREYRWSKDEAAKQGIPLINFIEHYPNETGYISQRLHRYL